MVTWCNSSEYLTTVEKALNSNGIFHTAGRNNRHLVIYYDYEMVGFMWGEIIYAIVERDNWQCQKCGITDRELIIKYAEKLLKEVPRWGDEEYQLKCAHRLKDVINGINKHENINRSHTNDWRTVRTIDPSERFYYRLEVHHINLVSEDGKSLPGNLITLCHSCHFPSEHNP